MQKRSFVTLLLLAAFGFGLLAGAHPCGALHGEKQDQRSVSFCHDGVEAGQGASVLPSLPAEEEAPSCCDTFCQHACHMTAVTETTPVVIAIAPVARAVTEAADPGLALFVHPIDHVPLV